MTGVERLQEFLRNQRLRWFGHVKKISKEKETALAMDMKIKVKGKNKRRPKKGWMKVLRIT